MKFNDDCLDGKPSVSFELPLAGLCPQECATGASCAAKHELILQARGKFLYAAQEKFFVKSLWCDDLALFDRDFALQQMRELGANTVWLKNPDKDKLDLFHQLGLRIVACLDLESCFSALFIDGNNSERSWNKRVAELIKITSQHPAVIAYDLAAELCPAVLRDLGPARVERVVRRAFNKVKTLDLKRAITCSTNSMLSALKFDFLDFYSFKLNGSTLTEVRKELSRLQSLSADKPMLAHLAALSAEKKHEEEVAFSVDQQIRMAFLAGASGVGLPGDWWRSMFASSGRRLLSTLPAKNELAVRSAFEAARAALQECPFPAYLPYPKMSVVICVYNGEDYIEECLDGCARLDYPNFEVIVVNDGSTDRTLQLAESRAKDYGFKVVSQIPNAGLSAARNLGARSADGEIVAYLDSDAFPDEHWLRFLALTFLSYKYAIVGGPNINPLSTGEIVDCIDKAPGNSQVVMLENELADHIPGCNLAVRREFMLAIGGFDESYRGGGDDVTFCWRVIKAGGTLGVSPGAMVWHYRRPTIAAYLKQQHGYGKGEAVLERDYPERFNSLGHQIASAGKHSATNSFTAHSSASLIYQTLNGSESWADLWLRVFPSMPEWVMLLATLGALCLCGLIWTPFFYFAPVLLTALVMWLFVPIRAGCAANLRAPSAKNKAIVAFLHLAQPLVRLQGRLSAGLAPWRSRCNAGFRWPLQSVSRKSARMELTLLEENKLLSKRIRELKLPAVRGGQKSAFDWQIEGGILGGARLSMRKSAAEIVVKTTPYLGLLFWALLSIVFVVTIISILAQALPILVLAFFCCSCLIYRTLRHCGEAFAVAETLLQKSEAATIWETFQPPRHFFEAALNPGANAIAFARQLSAIKAAASDGNGTPLNALAEQAHAEHHAQSRCRIAVTTTATRPFIQKT